MAGVHCPVEQQEWPPKHCGKAKSQALKVAGQGAENEPKPRYENEKRKRSHYQQREARTKLSGKQAERCGGGCTLGDATAVAKLDVEQTNSRTAPSDGTEKDPLLNKFKIEAYL